MRIFTLIVLLSCAFSVSAKNIIHDAEYYVLEAQHGEKWAAQDKELDKKLATARRQQILAALGILEGTDVQ